MKKSKSKGVLNRIEDLSLVRAIRQGLVMTIPLLMIGSFALIFNILPIAPYQAFLEGDVGRHLSAVFVSINQVTFGLLSLAITISVSIAFIRERTGNTSSVVCGVLTSLGVYAIFVGLFTESFNIASFGAQGMFTAIFSAVAGSALYCRLAGRRWLDLRLYTIGADNGFNTVISAIIPTAIVISLGYFLNLAISLVFNVNGFEALFHSAMVRLFSLISNNSLKALLFIFLTSLLWFFGIHGTNVLDTVARNIFFTSVAETSSQLEGQNLLFFLNKPVIDVFVFMGGCGATISLLVAILLFSKKKNTKGLARMAAFPMFFNINELMVFGLPIVFNPSFFIPFLLVPFACVASTALALGTGLVPPPVNPVSWVMPIFVNGYQATGSIAGSLLQLFNIVMGAFIYRFFLLRYEKRTNERILNDTNKLVEEMKEAESQGDSLILMELKGHSGEIAKMLASDLEHVLKTEEPFKIYYQPQYNEKNACIGAEALLRWEHPLCGMVYPPLVVGLASEAGLLGKLERKVFEIAVSDLQLLLRLGIAPDKLSVNATSATLGDPEFLTFLTGLHERHPEISSRLCIELTEQMSFMLTGAMEKRLEAIRELGISFAVDDFSMGQTSIKYLQSSLFELVKLDGNIVRDMVHNERSVDIIWSIINMSQSMGFDTLAEFVETMEQRDMLREMGCFRYQGYLYSPPIPIDKLIERLKGEALSCPYTPYLVSEDS